MMKAEEKRNMRKYGKDGRLESVICNRCGRKLAVRNGIVREGVFSSDHAWDFFSEKDFLRHPKTGISFRRRMGRFTILICVRSAMMR